MIVIPVRLEELLQRERALHSYVEESVANFELLLKWSMLPFFPEFTDHGSQHLTDVLTTADALVSETAWALLSPKDAACLILSTLLHDAGMHLSVDGFLSLISPSQQAIVAPRIDRKRWEHLWEEFLSEARRFDGKRLVATFGTSEPITVPPSDPELMTLRDRRLIGEFVRRHHARLAHEIALRGMPGTDGVGLSINIPYDLRDLAGLIARSHGSPLRTFLPYLEKHYHPQEYQQIHAVFLMALLRIADYLQVESERAPEQHLKVAKLRSPLSQQEWRNHAAIANITTQDKDPEAIQIQARPQDVKTYLELTRLLRGLQLELDTSWAVLGEIYGLREKLKRLGLEIRRIKSNLDDEESFGEFVDYVPCKASFESAGADLLKLLAEPLYGDDPTYGVRELIQNAVDACLELRDLPESIRMAVKTGDRPDVVVKLTRDAGGNSILTIDDRGIGMTSVTLRNYFLRAGASYRKSSEWKKVHEDEAGHSRVLRSGRFGIGVLAAFILGDEIQVSTRHALEERGIEFEASLETDPIELKYVNRPIGTRVSVKLHKEVAARLQTLLGSIRSRSSCRFGSLPSGLYLLNTPSLGIEVGGENYLLDRRWPSAATKNLPPGWHRLKGTDFAEVHWTFKEFGNLACNGIAVADPDPKTSIVSKYTGPKWFDDPTYLGLQTPSVSVFDPDGRFPLKLTRTELSTFPLPFNQLLVDDICRDLCAYLLAESWKPQFSGSTLPSNPVVCAYRGLGRKLPISYLCTEDGFTLAAADIVPNLNIPRIVLAGVMEKGTTLPRFEGAGTAVMVQPATNIGQQTSDTWGKNHLSAPGRVIPPWGKISGVRMYAHQKTWERWKTKIARAIVKTSRIDCRYGDWLAIESGLCGQRSTVEDLAAWADTESDVKDAIIKPAFAEYHLSPKKVSAFTQGPFFGRTMAELLGGFVIPYSSSKRQQRFPRAFDQLAEYVSAHLNDQTS